MKLLMHILKKNLKLGIDNEMISIKEISEKLKEEFYEVIKALNNYNNNKTVLNLKEVVSVTFDLIQICILILWRFHKKALDLDERNLIQDINLEHKDKLISEKGWIVETGIQIEVIE